MNAVLLIALCIGLLTTEVEAFALGVAAGTLSFFGPLKIMKKKLVGRIVCWLVFMNIMDSMVCMDAMARMNLLDCMVLMELMDEGVAHNLRTFYL